MTHQYQLKFDNQSCENINRKEVGCPVILDKNVANEEKTLEKRMIERYSQIAFADLKKNIIQDLINNRNESVIYKKYPKDRVVSMLENPQASEKQLREMSNFLYIVSSHYRRLINYYAKLPKFNYVVIPTNLPQKAKIKKTEYRKTYFSVVNMFKKYNLKQESGKITQAVFRDGIFYGLTFETSESFYIRQFNPNFAKISSIEDGCFIPSIDLNYFSDKKEILPEYGEEIVNAYNMYKGDPKRKIKGNPKLRWFEPSNGICIKIDDDDPYYALPVFTGLILDVLSIEDYKLLKKAKKEIDNYKVLAMKMDTDEDGIPKMDYDLAMKYYNQACANIPDGIGLILSPFTINEFSFQHNASAESDAAVEAEDAFWSGAGTSPLLFGSTKATSSSSLTLSVKPDEQISFAIINQISRYFNKKIKKMDLPYSFEMRFLEQSIFNETAFRDSIFKGAQYGVSGAKLTYASSLGMEPADIIGMAYLEDDILEVGKRIFTTPLISSNTMSYKTEDNQGGRSTNDSQGLEVTDSTETGIENNGNHEDDVEA